MVAWDLTLSLLLYQQRGKKHTMKYYNQCKCYQLVLKQNFLKKISKFTFFFLLLLVSSMIKIEFGVTNFTELGKKILVSQLAPCKMIYHLPGNNLNEKYSKKMAKMTSKWQELLNSPRVEKYRQANGRLHEIQLFTPWHKEFDQVNVRNEIKTAFQ